MDIYQDRYKSLLARRHLQLGEKHQHDKRMQLVWPNSYIILTERNTNDIGLILFYPVWISKPLQNTTCTWTFAILGEKHQHDKRMQLVWMLRSNSYNILA